MLEYVAKLEVARGIGGGAGCFCHPLRRGQLGGEQGGHDQDWHQLRSLYERSVGLSGYVLDLAARGTYYLNCKTGQASMTAIGFKGSEQKTKIRAVCGICNCGSGDRGLNLLIIRRSMSP